MSETTGTAAPEDPTASAPITPATTQPDDSAAPAPTAAPVEDASKPTEEWVTGDEPMTGPQHSYLQTLAREAGRDLPEQLTKAQASDLIEELQATTGRGQ
jgi:hypothetical protein